MVAFSGFIIVSKHAHGLDDIRDTFTDRLDISGVTKR